MLAIVQFPISDSRLFHVEAGLQLEQPDWPNPRTDIKPQFVHYFGHAVERRLQVDQVWPYEMKFCQARRALRFNDLTGHPVGFSEKLLHPQCVFRRLFCDGESVVRVEVGIAHNQQIQRALDLTPHQVLGIAVGLCDLPTLVPQVGEPACKNKLLLQGSALARLYSRATLSKSAISNISKASLAEQLVEDGIPLLLLYLEGREAVFPLIPDGFTRVRPQDVFGANLAFGRVKTRNGIVSTWLLQRGQATHEQIRSLRLCLLRLHAEQETLDIVIKQIKRKHLLNPLDENTVTALDLYFNKKTRLINRAEWAGIGQSAILAAYDAAVQVTPPSSRLDLIERYDGAHNQVWKKVEEYQIRRAAIREVSVVNVQSGGTFVDKSVTNNQSGTGNILNVAEYMSGITNQVTNNLGISSATDEIKTLIKQLTERVNEISTKIDPKHTMTMGSDLQTLTNELTHPEPRSESYKVSLNGLKDAAKAIGEIANPIVVIVKKLLPLLGLA